jgi:uncharacterized protein YqgV (UPF0045/DUF77 family)
MRVVADISLYPLDADFIPPVDDVIRRLNAHPGIEVATNAMSTQLRGEYVAVMAALTAEMGQTFADLDKAVFVIKILNNPLADC